MMTENIMALLKERRSIRNYSDEPVSDNALQVILEAVQWTPSWANTQCWEIVVVKDPDIKLKLQQAVPAANPAFKSIVSAPVVLALCARKGTSGYYKDIVTTRFGDWFMFDIGLAAQSICLAAQAQGLGTLIVGLYEHDKVDGALNLPKDIENVALITMGYATKVPKAPKRKEISEFTHQDVFLIYFHDRFDPLQTRPCR
jgi:nitroreductase